MIEWILMPFGWVLYGLAMVAAKGAELLDAIQGDRTPTLTLEQLN